MATRYYEAPARAACSGCHPESCLLPTCLRKIHHVSTPVENRPALIAARQEEDRKIREIQAAFRAARN